jgi:hypothetical protein
MMSRIASGLVCLIAIASDSPHVSADESDTARTQVDKLKSKILNGYVAGRHKLVSGRFHFDHVLENDPPSDGVVTSSNGERIVVKKGSTRSGGTYTFDGGGSQLRINVNSLALDGKPLEKESGGQFARTQHESIVRDAQANVVLIGHPVKAAPPWANCFDVRALGGAHAVKWDEISLSEVVKIYEKQPVIDVTEMQGLHRLRWVLTIPVTRERFLRTIWFREAHDFAAERIELQRATTLDENIADTNLEWGPVVQSQVTKYEQRDDIWVPTSAEIYCHESFRHKLQLKWDWVNQKCDDSEFKWQGFDLSKVNSVFDARLNPIHVLWQR